MCGHGQQGTPKQRAESRIDSTLVNYQSCPSGHSSVRHGHRSQRDPTRCLFLSSPQLGHGNFLKSQKCLVVAAKSEATSDMQGGRGRGVHTCALHPMPSMPWTPAAGPAVSFCATEVNFLQPNVFETGTAYPSSQSSNSDEWN